MKYLLSILIPTRNRQNYAIKSLRQIYYATDDSVQIIIQDNSDIESLSKLISCSDYGDRVIYNHSDKIMTLIDNFNEGMRFINGEYVCFIGDDDGVLPKIVDLVKWAKRMNIDAICPVNSIHYIWPDFNRFNTEKTAGSLLYVTEFSSNVEYLLSIGELIKLLHNGSIGYHSSKLIKLYYGIVKYDKLHVIYQKTGKYCGGLSPDIYLSTLLAIIINKYIFLDYPLIIIGSSKSSSVDKYNNKSHDGLLSDAPHFNRRAEPYEWSDLVPPFYSGKTIWADSTLAALTDFGRDDLIKEFKLTPLAFECLIHHRYYYKEILSHYKKYHPHASLLALFFGSIYYIYKKYVQIVNKKISYIFSTKTKTTVTGVMNTEEAQIKATEILDNAITLDLNNIYIQNR